MAGMNGFRGLTALVLAVGLAGCASKVRLDEDAPVEDRTAVTRTGQGAGAQASGVGTGAGTQAGLGARGVTTVDAAGRASGVLSGAANTVYFDFDSFTIRDESRPVIDAQGRRLTAERTRGLMLEGHTDERGGREYNLALGQKRADAVQRALLLLGVQASQLEAVSLGEERPADPGSGEAAWARNRRVEMKDR